MAPPWQVRSSTRSPGAPTITSLPPTPEQIQDREWRAQTAANDARKTESTLQNADDERRARTFNQTSGLRGDYNQEMAVRKYNEAVPVYVSSLRTAPNGTGDLSLVYAYAKIMDPTSVVRDSEVASAGQTSAWADRKLAELQGQLTQSGGQFSNEVRNRLRAEMTQRMAQMNQQYNTQRQRYRDIAGRGGYTPEDVIGPHIGKPNQEFVHNYWANQPGYRISGQAPASAPTSPINAGVNFANQMAGQARQMATQRAPDNAPRRTQGGNIIRYDRNGRRIP